MAIAGDDLGQQLKVTDLIRADEGSDVFVQAVELQQALIRNVGDGQGASGDRVGGFGAQRWD